MTSPNCTLTAEMYSPPFGTGAPCLWFFIQGVPLQLWAEKQFTETGYDFRVEATAVAQIWLYDDDEDALAMERIAPAESGTSTVVPILVCSDDMDFGCIVIVAEQVVEDDTVSWTRLGLSASTGLKVGVNTRWLTKCDAVFDLAEFSEAVERFKQLRHVK
ncbi:hypothetical protein [Silvimonas iriomotensis]|uniref:CheW-like domain-containing protein n=1 Tax=Silvimonas iriomotensis TaxID=449662 RepID=A0ABQ2PAQ2_9NEIS|nr:hypothetical protein [Silvimonas iriomotensis]GGP22044.1 hypothetical protein GCM10010970_23120 [Silvimonas iriomotensis]